KTSIFSHPVYLFLREFSLQDFRGGSKLTRKNSSSVISVTGN
ncbi:Rha family transcriptional regulator, partial [Escherichia coli]